MSSSTPTTPSRPSSTPLSSTPRSTLTRKKERASGDRADLHSVLDAGLLCHVAVVSGGSPVCVPTGYGRDGDTLYLHGSTGSGNVRAASSGVDICVTVTILDGIVYARSLNNHTFNYRCAMIHGRARTLTGDDERDHALHVISEHLAPGSWDYARRPSAKELAGVTVLALDLEEASVKLRDDDPGEQPEDVDRDDVWAGVIGVRTVFDPPTSAAYVPADVKAPPHVTTRTP
ncbi:flavin-nucleotide-binding protein [Saccharomonospora sp. CUA-673]|uniref:pyridoxamine 5'-phosphate oxidase family protein n=1 Tax=Saccharomonospora sp. CUA-673 TaxID=1904969 RepID=UPI000965170B|nr:pyridoxamine 5'-phosphate oxidase family protein [Saccharomonospora sp. CUA-673]OLT46266.1 flavin-nucleotide-binding protein [Saccharomonospora sp. CUA-673]